MTKFVYAIVLLATLGASFHVFCQKTEVSGSTPKVSGPLLYKPPSAIDAKRFAEPDGFFQADFYGVPVATSKDSETNKTLIYSVNRGGSTSSVTVFEFPMSVKSRQSYFVEEYRRDLPTMITQGRSVPGGVQIEIDRDIEILGPKGKKIVFKARPIDARLILTGREFAVNSGLVYARVVVVVSDSRLYVLRVTVANWSVLTEEHPEMASAFNAEADKFFRSFEILK